MHAALTDPLFWLGRNNTASWLCCGVSYNVPGYETRRERRRYANAPPPPPSI